MADTGNEKQGFTVSFASDEQKAKIARARENQIRAAGGKKGLEKLEPKLTPETKKPGESGVVTGKRITQEVRIGNIMAETAPTFGPGGSHENKPMFPPYPKEHKEPAPKQEPGTSSTKQ